jgi:hypothetical protein
MWSCLRSGFEDLATRAKRYCDYEGDTVCVDLLSHAEIVTSLHLADLGTRLQIRLTRSILAASEDWLAEIIDAQSSRFDDCIELREMQRREAESLQKLVKLSREYLTELGGESLKSIRGSILFSSKCIWPGTRSEFQRIMTMAASLSKVDALWSLFGLASSIGYLRIARYGDQAIRAGLSQRVLASAEQRRKEIPTTDEDRDEFMRVESLVGLAREYLAELGAGS